MRMPNQPELLCPAGSYAALEAAIEGGADAIYLGGTLFNARIHAKNFTPEELRRGIDLAHAFGVKIYLAANTLIYDRETDLFLRAAEEAYLSGADALILADIGCAEAIRRRIPMELHASTQLSGHNVSAARLLEKAGFSRMVCAREMSETDLRSFCRESPIEAEVFVHGALCVCHSGQCLFSSLVGGRSGNRGECAQPCRLPYTLANGKQGYPMSLKDLSLASHLPALCEMGVASLKIEGRMKSPEYVRDVAQVFRRLLDEHRAADGQELAYLASIFSRDGFTDGYFKGKLDRSMFGIRSEADKALSRESKPFSGLTKKQPITLSARIQKNCPAELTVALGSVSFTAQGELPQEARTAPLTEETVRRQLTRLGATPFEASHMSLTLEEGLMLPISALNALRRAAIEGLETARKEQAAPARTPSDFLAATPLIPKGKRSVSRSAVFFLADRIPKEAYSFFDLLYVPLEQYVGQTDGVLLPPVIYDSEREGVAQALARAKELGAKHVLVGNLGHLPLAEECGLVPHGDFRLNLCNNQSVAVAEALGFEDVILSPELTLPRIRDIGGASAAIVYGRIPLMVTETCLVKATSGCETCGKNMGELMDRKGIRFPVLRLPPHRNLILNSVPVYMADRSEELRRASVTVEHFLFTTETEQEILRILRAYETGLPPKDQNVRRIRS